MYGVVGRRVARSMDTNAGVDAGTGVEGSQSPE